MRELYELHDAAETLLIHLYRLRDHWEELRRGLLEFHNALEAEILRQSAALPAPVVRRLRDGH
ncbi:MAG: hypothetical protein QN130_12370 [Armatimonadota bacterium]|nr:hypothetical protein [Armatimonadota bacterium]